MISPNSYASISLCLYIFHTEWLHKLGIQGRPAGYTKNGIGQDIYLNTTVYKYRQVLGQRDA
jgi:hypothetical protein